MADITMCSTNNCPIKNDCYRARATASEHQSWSNFEYTCNENNGYPDFILVKIKKNDKIIKNGR